MVAVSSLEDVCFSFIVRSLGEYSIEYLSLLPRDVRFRLLEFCPPIVDLCRVEGTQFTEGFDMELIWKKMFNHYFRSESYCPRGRSSWKDSVFSELISLILRNQRPYGFLNIRNKDTKLEDNIVHEHPVDKVNYLLARAPARKFWCRDLSMKRHDVALSKDKGIVSPGELYDQAMSLKQIFPAHNKHYFPEGSLFLPDSTALRLITGHCNYYPKELEVWIGYFGTFLLYAQQEESSLEFVAKFLQTVESLKVVDLPEYDHNQHTLCQLFQLLLDTPSPKLVSLSLGARVIDCVTPCLTTTYNGLRRLDIRAKGSVSPDIDKLTLIKNHHNSLATLKIEIAESYHRVGCGNGPIKTLTPEFSLPSLSTFLKGCFNTLQLIIVTLNPITARFLIQLVADFLSAKFPQKQKLIFSDMTLGERELLGNFYKGPRKFVLKHAKLDTSQLDMSDMVIGQFDQNYLKSIEFHECSFTPLFNGLFMQLGPMKLNELSVKPSGNRGSNEYLNAFVKYFMSQESIDIKNQKYKNVLRY